MLYNAVKSAEHLNASCAWFSLSPFMMKALGKAPESTRPGASETAFSLRRSETVDPHIHHMQQSCPVVVAWFYCHFNHVFNATVVLLLFLLPLNALGLLCNYGFVGHNCPY